MRQLNIAGQTFGKLTAIEKKGFNKMRQTLWLCKCECGKECIQSVTNLRIGHTKSCGCLSRTHGLKKHPLYATRTSMIQRCSSPSHSSFKYYGGRGIKVCDAWKNSPVEFFKWALVQWEPGLVIDRVDERLGYCPENCRFISRSENGRRKRRTGKNIGKVFGTWRITSLIYKTENVHVECKYCHRQAIFQQSNVIHKGQCRQCKCA